MGFAELSLVGLLETILNCILAGLLVYAAFEDVKDRYVSSAPLIWGCVIILGIQVGLGCLVEGVYGAVSGLVVSGEIYAICRLVSSRTGKDYFGAADVLVSVLIGSAIGAKAFIGVFFCAFYLQLLVSLFLRRRKGSNLAGEFPFVAALAAATMINGLVPGDLVDNSLYIASVVGGRL